MAYDVEEFFRKSQMSAVDAFFAGPPRTGPDFSALMQTPLVPPPEPPGITSSAWQRGWATTKADLAQSAALGLGAVGADDMETSMLKYADEQMKFAAELPKYAKDFDELETGGDYALFAWETLVENMPMLATLAVPGFTGAKIASKVFKAGTETAKAVGAATAAAADYGILTGETAGAVRETGEELEGNRGLIAGTGALKAALDFMPFALVAKNMGLLGKANSYFTEWLAHQGFITRAGVNMATIAASEIPTETLQEGLDIVAEKVVKDALDAGFSEQDVWRLKAAAAGASTFALLGIPAAVMKPQVKETRPDVEEEETPPEFALTPPPSEADEFVGPTFPPNGPVLPEGYVGAPEPLPIPGEALAGPTRGQMEFDFEGRGGVIKSGDFTIGDKVARRIQILKDGKQRNLTQAELDDAESLRIESTVPAERRTPAQQFMVQQKRLRDLRRMRDVAQGIEGTTGFTGPLTEKGLRSPIQVVKTRVDKKNITQAKRLKDARERLLSNPLSYRKDGELRVVIEKRLAKIDRELKNIEGLIEDDPAYLRFLDERDAEAGRPPEDIIDLVARTVIPEPNQLSGLPRQTQTPREILSGVRSPEQAAPQIPPTAAAEVDLAQPEDSVTPPTVEESSNLNPREQAILAKLQEREATDGLNEAGYAQLERLLAKQAGEQPAAREKSTDQKELENLAKEIGKDETVLRKKEGGGKGIGVSAVRAAIRRLQKIFGIEVEVVDSDTLAKMHLPTDSEGLTVTFADGTRRVFLNADRIPSVYEAKITYLHEVIGHFGVRSVLTQDQMRQIQEMLGMPDVVSTEEYIARLAENTNYAPKLWRKIVNFFKRVFRLADPELDIRDEALRNMLRDVAGKLRERVINKYSPDLMGPAVMESPVTILHKKLSLEGGEQHAGEVAQWNSLWEIKFGRYMYTPLQMLKRFGRLAPVEVKGYLDRVEQWWNTKMRIISEAEPLATRWNALSALQGKRLGEALLEINLQSERQERRLSPAEVEAMLRRLQLDDKTKALYYEIDKSFTHILNRLEAGLKYSAARETLGSAEEATRFIAAWNAAPDAKAQVELLDKYDIVGKGARLNQRLTEIDKDFQQLRHRNYFPHMRFGSYAVTIKAEQDGIEYGGKKYKRNEVIIFETYESTTAQRAAAEKWMVEKPAGSSVTATTLKDEEFAFLGMPPSLFATIEEQLTLTEEQRNRLKEIFIRNSPGRAFLRHLIKRRGVEGFSADASRVFATYVLNAANHIARVEHYRDMQDNLLGLETRQKGFDPILTAEARKLDPNAPAVPAEGIDQNKVGVLANYFNRHYKYIMNPGNDLAKLRAIGFMWYLGFNAKSAVVNLSQVPLVTYPYLAARFGDSKAISALTKAMPAAAKFARGLNAQLSPEVDAVIKRLSDEGLLDESMAVNLAGFTESDPLEKMVPKTKSGRLFDRFSLAGAWMFRNAEKYNRYVTAIASARLAVQEGASVEEAYRIARQTVQSTQFEYAKWNRPEFMRGKKSVFFLFWQYMQHASFLAFGGHNAGTAVRFWTLLLLAAGFQGLPFAENLLDLYDWSSAKLKSLTGWGDPHTDSRKELRELVVALGGDPNLWMHGMSSYFGLGPLHLLEAVGVPIPRTDVSGSLSMGRVIPGIESLTDQAAKPEEKFGRTVIEAMGPVMGMPYVLWRALADDNPDLYKRWERAMPTAIKGAMRGTRWMTRGGEEFRGGGELIGFDMQDIDQRLEAITQMFGFAPSRLNRAYELSAAQESTKRYYGTKRTLLMEDYAWAKTHNRMDMLADVKREIRKFNHTAPHPKLRITPNVLRQSLSERARRSKDRTAGRSSERMFRGLYSDLEKVYPQQE